MSGDLESGIRRAVKNGFLWLALNKDWDGPNWTVSYRTTDSNTIRSVKSPDPVEALHKALRGGGKAVSERRPAGIEGAVKRRHDDRDLI